jgi:hypothetical protein
VSRRVASRHNKRRALPRGGPSASRGRKERGGGGGVGRRSAIGDLLRRSSVMASFKSGASAVLAANTMERAAAGECVKVVVRCRPLFGKELKEGRGEIVECDPSRGEMRIRNPRSSGDPPKQFTFDQVYDARHSQLEIFEATALPIVRAAIEGYNGTIFAYGQTGTGKTHTMEGRTDVKEGRGIIPNAFETIFADIDAGDGTNKNFLVRASYLEIYNEDVRDLLGKDQKKPCQLKEHPDTGVYVKDLTTFVVKSVEEIEKVLAVGKKNRSVGATAMNADSSRSHSIFTITIETSEVEEGAADEDARIRVGKLNLVDLAGSERQGKTGSTGDRLKEATKINLSLSTLGNVISSLVDGKSTHVPYRDSKLTRLLEDSLGGNTKTVMVANIGPADYNFEETMSTLRYANRAKNIKNKPRINEDPKDAMLREFQEEIARLKAQLGEGAGGGVGPDGEPIRRRRREQRVVEKTVNQVSDARLDAIRETVRREMEENHEKGLEAAEAEKAQKIVRERANEAMQRLMEEKTRTEEERADLEMEFKKQQAEASERFAALQAEKDAQKVLEDKLASMQAKVMRGGTNLLDQEERLREEQRRQADQLAKIAAQEAEASRRMKELQEIQTITGDEYRTLDEEIETKASKTRKLYDAYQRVVADTKDLDLEFEREREDLLDSIRALTREIKLKNLVLDAFVPPDQIAVLSRAATWDAREEAWHVHGAAYSGNAARARREAAANPNPNPSDKKKKKMRKKRGGYKNATAEVSAEDVENVAVFNALADAYGGDTQRALVAATASDSEKLKLAYLKYKETVPGAEDGGGSGSGSGSSARPGTAKSRGRPGSARPMSSSGRRKEEKRAAVGIGRLSDEMATASLSRDEIFPEPRGFVSRR